MLFVKMWKNAVLDDLNQSWTATTTTTTQAARNELNCFAASANGYSLRQLVNKQDLQMLIDQLKNPTDAKRLIVEIYEFLYGKDFLLQFQN